MDQYTTLYPDQNYQYIHQGTTHAYILLHFYLNFVYLIRMDIPSSLATTHGSPLSPSHPPPVKKQHSNTGTIGLPQLHDMPSNDYLIHGSI